MVKLQRWITFVVLVLAGTVLFVVTATVFLQVVFRYVLRSPLAWSVETARFLFTWASMLGAAGGTVKLLNQSIDLFTRKLPQRFQTPIDLFARVVTLGTSTVLFVTGLELTGRVWRQYSSALQIRMSYVYAAVPVGLFFIIVLLLLDTWNSYRKPGAANSPASETAT